MSRITFFSIFIALLMVSLLTTTWAGAWEENGLAICTESGNQEAPQIVADGVGGVFIIWQDMRNGDWDIFAQRLDQRGEKMWGPNDLAISSRPYDQTDPRAVTDGAGGFWAVWTDQRSSRDIYGQHVAADGTFSWQENGAPVCSAQSDQFDARIVANGYGGVVAVWTDTRSLDGDIYAQHINAGGSFLWQYHGNLVCNQGLNQTHPELALIPGSDWEDTRLTVVWEDARNGSLDIYAQRMTLAGELQWGSTGIPVEPSTYDQERPQVIGGLSGSSFVAWETNRSYTFYYDSVDLWELDRYGNSSLLWSPYAHTPRLEPDGDGGVLMCYTDHGAWEDRSDPRVVRYDADGAYEYNRMLHSNHFFPPLDAGARMAPDGSGGGIACYFRNNYQNGHLIEAIRISADGDGDIWGGSVSVCSVVGFPYRPEIIMLDEDYALVAWQDNRDLASTGEDIYAQRLVYADGAWGYEPPHIVAVADLPGDSGGAVVIHLEASDRDIANSVANPVTGYNVWRRMDDALGRSSDQSQVLQEMSNPDKAAGLQVDEEMAARLGFPEGSWLSLGFHAAIQQREYDLFAPTLNDSSSTGIPWETYVVTAHTPVPAEFYVSNEVSGYSVDNSPPDELSDTVSGALSRGAVLAQNRPNPFNPSTTIVFEVARDCRADLRVFDMSGRLVRQLMSGEMVGAGHHQQVWNGRDDKGRLMPSGSYYYCLDACGVRETKRMVLIK